MSRRRGGLLTGLVIGAGLGLLFAPKKGSETRAELVDKLNELWDKVKELEYDDVKKTIEKKIKELQKELADMDKEKFGKICRDQAAVVKGKAQEIYELAKEKGTPVLQKAAKDVLTKSGELLTTAGNNIDAPKAPAKPAAKKPAAKKAPAKKPVAKKTTKK